MGTTDDGMTRRAALRGVAAAAAAGLGAGFVQRVGAQDATPAPGAAAPITVQQVSLAQAQGAIDAAIADAETRGLRMVIAVVDAGANLVALARMDGAQLVSLDVAIKKARTSALIQAPTAALGPLVQPGGQFYGAEITNEGLISFGGGLPLAGADGAVIGAIGVSGSTAEDDAAVAEAGASALGAAPGTPVP